jgi:hypothetical protein
MDGRSRRRRPQWRGERKAVLIRLPVDVATQLAELADEDARSVSDTAGDLIAQGLRHDRRQTA